MVDEPVLRRDIGDVVGDRMQAQFRSDIDDLALRPASKGNAA
jgi:hypothetical protein